MVSAVPICGIGGEAMKLNKKQLKTKRHKKVRSRIFGSKNKPRICVFRSNKHIYAQLIIDADNKVVGGFSDMNLKSNKGLKGIERARQVGLLAGDKFLKLGFKNIIFDRGGYKYHGQVKALADGLREAGLKF